MEEKLKELEIRVAVLEKLFDMVTKKCDEAIIKASVLEYLTPKHANLEDDSLRRFDTDLDLRETAQMSQGENLPPRRIPSPYELNIAGLRTANPEKPPKGATFGSSTEEVEEDLRIGDDE